jgi:hypothetical protein
MHIFKLYTKQIKNIKMCVKIMLKMCYLVLKLSKNRNTKNVK